MVKEAGYEKEQWIKQDKYADYPDIKVLESGMEDRESTEDNSLEWTRVDPLPRRSPRLQR